MGTKTLHNDTHGVYREPDVIIFTEDKTKKEKTRKLGFWNKPLYEYSFVQKVDKWMEEHGDDIDKFEQEHINKPKPDYAMRIMWYIIAAGLVALVFWPHVAMILAAIDAVLVVRYYWRSNGKKK